MAKGKRVKKSNSKAPLIAVILLVIVLVIGMCVIGKIIIQNYNTKTAVANDEKQQAQEELEKKYEIDNLENYTFENAKIKVENNVSYVNIDVKNNGNTKTAERKVTLIFTSADRQMRTTYTIPEIEQNDYYTISFNIISNLSDIDKIEIK